MEKRSWSSLRAFHGLPGPDLYRYLPACLRRVLSLILSSRAAAEAEAPSRRIRPKARATRGSVARLNTRMARLRALASGLFARRILIRRLLLALREIRIFRRLRSFMDLLPARIILLHANASCSVCVVSRVVALGVSQSEATLVMPNFYCQFGTAQLFSRYLWTRWIDSTNL